MTNHNLYIHGILGLAVLAAGCDEDPGDLLRDACVAEWPNGAPTTLSEAGILVTVSSELAASSAAAELTLTGTAEHTRGFSLRRLTIAGVDAKSTSNFAQWSVTLPLAALGSLPRDPDGRASLAVRAIDACGGYDGEALPLTLDVPKFETKLRYPGGADHLPADGVTAAVWTITADNPHAIGMRIRVEAAEGAEAGVTLDGSYDGTVTLAAAEGGAAAEVRVRATTAGSHTLLARSQSLLQWQEVAVAGPPRFIPAELELAPGELHDAVVLSDGSLRECWGTTALTGLAVTLAGSDVFKAPASGPDGVDVWSLRISSDPAIAADGTARITCRDEFLQTSELTITVDD